MQNVHILYLSMTLAAAACEQRAPEPAPAAPSSGPAVPSAAERDQVVAQATAVINPFKKQLSEALTGAMTQGGPLAAIEVCSEKAQSLAAQAATPTVTVGRSALKLRNPSNAPRQWLKPVLDELSALPSAEGAQRVVRVDAEHFGYAEAITLKPQCVVCHGTEVAAPVAEKLKERYPADQATGFQPGQLRGVFWAEVALAKAP
jgi:hypothetical protein